MLRKQQKKNTITLYCKKKKPINIEKGGLV